ncbi:hypothetical protein [Streptomyces sp. SudanB25_2051]|uniref:hypothetical protein n=1 Tax=Streptomyces sp. SudanB25_2051 TaxID=3035275 RepID=UPI003F568DA9
MTRVHRALRAAVPAALAGPALWLAAPIAAHAHGGGLAVDITGQSSGRVEATVTWAGDGDPVEERVAATVNAVSADGRALGPWPLVRAPGTPAGYTTDEALPPGRWQVTVEIGHPGLGRAQERLEVSPGTPASSPPPRPDGAPATGAATAGPGTPDAPGTGPGPAAGTASAPVTGPVTGPASGGSASGSAPAAATGTGSASGTRPAAASGTGTARGAAPAGGSAVAVTLAAGVAVACATGFVLARRRAGALPRSRTAGR